MYDVDANFHKSTFFRKELIQPSSAIHVESTQFCSDFEVVEDPVTNLLCTSFSLKNAERKLNLTNPRWDEVSTFLSCYVPTMFCSREKDDHDSIKDNEKGLDDKNTNYNEKETNNISIYSK